MSINFGKFLHTPQGRILMSALLGLGLASLFRAVCKGNRCHVFRAPPLVDIQGKVYKQKGGHCVRYTPVPAKCDAGSKVVTFE